jgi:UDP-N-acetylmuramoyl-tripeptide--D-alanyl-D-alanine ligase
MQFSLNEIAAILGSQWRGPDGSVSSYSIDSRSLEAGDLFFAIRGPRHDGHDFIEHVMGKGAKAAVVSNDYRPPRPEWDAFLLPVPDTTRALQQLAHAARRKWSGRVIGITGSTGKTTTKEMIAALLSRRFSVLKTAGNLNNHYGVPLTLLRLEPHHQVAVIEMAMSGPGEIALLASLAEPQVGVVTNVAPVHLEFFDSIDSIARAKRELIEHLKAPAVAVLNYDDERVRSFSAGFQGLVVTYGFTAGADYQGLNLCPLVQNGNGHFGAEFEVRAEAVSGKFSIPLPGQHNVENALAAIATASLFGLSREEVRTGLESFNPPGQRNEILPLPGGGWMINDAYNSNPHAMRKMLETLASWPGARRRIVLAGEMLELGPSSPDWHRRIGEKCVEVGIDWLLAVQGDAQFFLEGAKNAGFPPERGRLFPDAEQAGRFYLEMAQAGDVVLVKGSRGVRLEKAIAVILNGFHTLTVKDSVAKDAGAAAGDSQDGFNSRETRQRNEFET